MYCSVVCCGVVWCWHGGMVACGGVVCCGGVLCLGVLVRCGVVWCV